MSRLKVLLSSLLMLFMASSVAALQNVPDARYQLRFRELPAALRVRDFDICLVGMAGRFSCMRKQEVLARFDTLSGRDRELIGGMLDRINAGVGNRTVNDMLVHCMGEWRSVKAPSLGAGSISSGPRRQNNGALARHLARVRTDAMRNACTAGTPAAGRAGSSVTGARDYDRQVASVVSGFDQAVASCQDPGNSAIAQSNYDDRLLRARINESVSSDTVNHVAQLLLLLHEALAPLAEAARAEDARRRRAIAEAEADIARRTPEEQEAKQCLEATQCAAPATQTQMPLPPGEGGGTSCAAKQARWDAFKERCDRSRWGSYECVAFVRQLNGCVDMTRIQPGPDGDLTCPVSQSESDRQALRAQQQCRRLGMIGRPRPGGGFDCGLPPPIDRPDRRIDICRDPRVTPEPGRCP